MATKMRGRSEPSYIPKLENTLRSLAEAPVITGTEIDIGLRRRPVEDFFLKGPLPLAELVPIAKMPGKTLALWLLIVYRVSFSRKGWVTLPAYALEEWGISKDAKIDALARLERPGRFSCRGPKAATSRCGWCGSRRQKLSMTVELEIEARRLNAIDEPLSYRLAVASLITRHGRDAVRRALIEEAARLGIVSIASAPGWRKPRPLTVVKVG